MDLSWPPSLGSSTADLIAKSVPSSAGSLPTASAKPGTSTDGLAEILEKKQASAASAHSTSSQAFAPAAAYQDASPA